MGSYIATTTNDNKDYINIDVDEVGPKTMQRSRSHANVPGRYISTHSSMNNVDKEDNSCCTCDAQVFGTGHQVTITGCVRQDDNRKNRMTTPHHPTVVVEFVPNNVPPPPSPQLKMKAMTTTMAEHRWKGMH
jgi:hypothetical protein